MQEVDVGRRRTVSAHRAAAARERRWQLRNWSGQPALAAHARLPDYERTAREKLLLLVELDAGSVGNLLLDEGERLSEIFWGVGGPSWKSSGPTGGHLSGELCECPTGGHLSESCAIAAQAKPLRKVFVGALRKQNAKNARGHPKRAATIARLGGRQRPSGAWGRPSANLGEAASHGRGSLCRTELSAN